MNISVCMYMYVCMYVYMYIYVCVCVYIYICIYVYVCIYIYHTRVLECGLRAFHSLLSNTLERGGMIIFTKSLSFIVWKLLI